ncbi:2-dehydro-3-deoxygalactonokinase [Eleftheria terrae]|uniref:2-dehydro-3-deoxygalactonokinase n=1 Tax=Eleftheria terrae TaxID=1597781 RepID=UPI00263A7194|nr:2-dehydro-3-deoxygalactonokinase [Eleftheria terrae]WKB50683.1 2-dehydro-3-deoxygalactonokinase [Eleftheria terrae]
MSTRDWVGIDWGSTHRRAWHFRDGALLARQSDDQGLLACAPHFEAALVALLQRFGLAPGGCRVVMSGMVGSAQGWHEVAYLDARLPLSNWRDGLVPVPGTADCWIVPGCRWRDGDAVDVMRGEETQLLGAQALPGTGDGWYVLPGTHSKWVRLQGGRVVVLRTYLSGELYALLSQHGTLAPLLQGTADVAGTPGAAGAFEQGFAAAREGALSHGLFGVRARVLAGDLRRELASAWLSGLLLGSEWQDLAARHGRPDGSVRVIGSPALAAWHARCGELLGLGTQVLDVEAVQVAAWQALGATPA